MRKVILYIAQTMDGFIARENGDIDFLPEVMPKKSLDFYNDFYNSIDTILIGRNTYDQIVKFVGPKNWIYQNKMSYIFTNELDKYENTDDKTFIKKDIVDFVNSIKNEAGKDIWILGGSKLIKNLIESNLIDNYIIATLPQIIGNGIPLFSNTNSIKLKITKSIITKEFSQISYEVINKNVDK